MVLNGNFLDLHTSRPVSEILPELNKIIDSDAGAHSGNLFSRSAFFLSGLGQRPYAGQVDERGFRFSFKLAIPASLFLPTASYEGVFMEMPDGKLQVKVVMKSPSHFLLRLLPVQLLTLLVILRSLHHWPIFTAMSSEHRVLLMVAILISAALSSIGGLYRHSIKVYNDLEAAIRKYDPLTSSGTTP